MDWKKFGAIAVVTLFVGTAIELLGEYKFYGADMAADRNLPWAASPIGGWPIVAFIGVVISIAFAYLFLKGYEGRGLMEGARFGFWVTLLSSVGQNLGYGTVLPVPHRLTSEFIAVDLANFVVCGMLAALIADKGGRTVSGAAEPAN